MIEHKPQADSNETPEDVATLYSWANLHGAKYRDFSSSRALAREESRLRVEAAQEAERIRLEEEAERKRQEEVQIAARLAAEAAEAERQAEAERLAEIARQAEAERQAVLAAQEAQRQAALQRSWQPPPPEAYQNEYAPSFDIDPALPPIAYAQFDAGEMSELAMSAEPMMAQFEPLPSPQNPPSRNPNSVKGPLPGVAPGQHVGQFAAQSQDRAPDVSSGSPWASSKPAQPPRARTAGWQPPVEVAYVASENSYAPDSRFASPSHRQAGYDEFADASLAGSEYPYPSQSSEPPASFRPAWLAPEPPPQPQPSAAPQQGRPAGAFPPPQAPPAQRHASSQPQESARQIPAPAAMATQYTGFPAQGQRSQQYESPMEQNQPPRQPAPAAPEHASYHPREPLTNRWYALKSVFDPQSAPAEPTPQAPPPRAPVLAVFSLAGGVGKTSLVASLGRALSSQGERVLLVDTAAYGLLPFFFGARDQRPGQLRTFNPPGTSFEPPIQLVTLDPEGQSPDAQGNAPQDPNQPPTQDWLAQEVGRYTRGVSRVLVDLPTASGSTTRRVLRLSPVVLVPILPDMNSVVSVGAIEAFFRHNGQVNGKQIMPYYVLNQFDYTLPLHLDVRELLREQLGERLLPFALRRSAAVSEALAEGMTVMDYAPSAVVAEDYASLAGWVRSLSAPATQMNRGVRWSER